MLQWRKTIVAKIKIADLPVELQGVKILIAKINVSRVFYTL